MSRSRHRPRSAVTAPARLGIHAVFTNAVRAFGWASPAQQRIAIALVEVGDWQPWLGEAVTLLSAEEAARVGRRRFATDRDALALAYALHRLLLGTVLGRDPGDVPLYRDERGCPRLADGLVYTSLSHADGLIALAATASGPVGVDIEAQVRAAVMPEIARSVCTRSETAELAALDDSARAAALLALWVRKEALLKAAGVGLSVPMETFAAPEHHALMLPELFADAVQVRMLGPGKECVAAVAGATGAVVDCRWLRPASGGAGTGRAVPGLDHADPAVDDAQ